MSKRLLPRPPTTTTTAVHHFHYHYFLPDPYHPSLPSPSSLKRVRSDIKLRLTAKQTDKTDAQSNSSRQSWKEAINPEFQKASPHTGRTFKPTSPTQKIVESLRKQYTHRSRRVDTNGSLTNTPRVYPQPERFSATCLPAKKQNETPSNRQPSITCLSDPQLPTPLSPQTSRFLKKPQVHTLNAKQPPATSRPLPSSLSQQPSNYRQTLLQEQCRYLRDRFLSHYERLHPQTPGSPKP